MSIKRTILAVISYTLAMLVGGYSLYLEIIPAIPVSIGAKLLLAAGYIALLICATLLAKSTSAKKQLINKVFVWLLFVYYILILIQMLFFDVGFGRTPSDINHIATSYNFVPFETITRYLKAWKQHGIYDKIALTNLIGNLLAFLPLGVFLPLLNPFFRKMRYFLFTAALIIICIETLQIIAMRGTCDIDDLILNLPGAILGFVSIKTFLIIRRRLSIV